MANQSLLTNDSKVNSVGLVYYLPTALLPYGSTTVPLSTIYCCLSKVDPWPNDLAPPAPTEDQKYLKNVFKNMFVAKKITGNNVYPVIQRINWTSGQTYSYYRDDIDMFQVDGNGNLLHPFYVKNRFDQVFKCLWNNNGQPSTMEPYFQPGQYQTDNIYYGTDGYKWKYIYTLDTFAKTKFMDTNWMPIPVNFNNAFLYNPSIGPGDIEVVNVTNGGQGYTSTNTTISIVGDGSGANVYPIISGNVITDVGVSSTGSGYTYANAVITTTDTVTNVATLICPVSPIGGHGWAPISELGCSHVMVSVEFNGPETYNGTQMVPTDITYTQLSLVVDPTTNSSDNLLFANGSIYKTTTDIIVSSNIGNIFTSDEIVYQADSKGNKIFTATVLSFDAASNLLKLINTTGTIATNQTIHGSSSGATRTVLSYSVPDFVLYSGNIIYIDNRSAIQRSADGIEQFKFVLGY